MHSGKRSSITAKAIGVIFSLFDVVPSRDVPFVIPQYVKCMHHGLTSVLLCVPFLFADSPRCPFVVVRCVASLQYVCKQSFVFSMVTGLIAEAILTLFFVTLCNGLKARHKGCCTFEVVIDSWEHESSYFRGDWIVAEVCFSSVALCNGLNIAESEA